LFIFSRRLSAQTIILNGRMRKKRLTVGEEAYCEGKNQLM
jgi:hypothetical protein